MSIVNKYLGSQVVITLDDGQTQEGLLEDVVDPDPAFHDYVKISNGDETFLIPEDQIVDIKPAALN